jgi:hypothetical protein
LINKGVATTTYTIATDPQRGLIRIAIRGFWTSETMAAYRRDLMTAVEQLPPTPGGHVTLCDISESAIQSQQVMAEFQAFISRTPFRSRRIAIYTSSPLSRMQGKRLVAGRSDMAVFETVADAEAWLFAADAKAA